jgi:rhodanese-related sulfurtransferase
MPLPVLPDSLDLIDPLVPVVTYCASGYRSLMAGSWLRSVGCGDVSDLIGGFNAWRASGLPIAL